jgi:hypothetical protein
MKSKESRIGRNLVWAAVVLLAFLHHDFWFWDDRRLVLGFMPVGLFYHAMFSLAAGCLWALAVKFAWPVRIEEWANEFEPKQDPKNGGPL